MQRPCIGARKRRVGAWLVKAPCGIKFRLKLQGQPSLQSRHVERVKAADLNQWLNHFISSGHVGYFKGKEGKEHYLMSATYA
jgi:hypothetical protein